MFGKLGSQEAANAGWFLLPLSLAVACHCALAVWTLIYDPCALSSSRSVVQSELSSVAWPGFA